MLKKLTNPYIILTLTVVSITLAIVAEIAIELFLVDVLLVLTILLISLRNFYRYDRVYSRKILRIVILLTLIAFLSDFMFHFKWIASLNQFFLVITVSIIDM